MLVLGPRGKIWAFGGVLFKSGVVFKPIRYLLQSIFTQFSLFPPHAILSKPELWISKKECVLFRNLPRNFPIYLWMKKDGGFFAFWLKNIISLAFEYPVSVFGNTNARYLLICSRHQWEGVICQTGATEPNSTLLWLLFIVVTNKIEIGSC